MCGPRRNRERERERGKDEISVQPLEGSCNYSSGGRGKYGDERSRETGFASMSLRK